MFDDVEALKEQVTTLSTSYVTTTNKHRIDISQNRQDISSNLSKINDIQSVFNASVNSVTFIDDGSGYTDQPPLVEFSGGGGTGAAANATLYTDNLDRKGPVTIRMNNLNGNSYDS